MSPSQRNIPEEEPLHKKHLEEGRGNFAHYLVILAESMNVLSVLHLRNDPTKEAETHNFQLPYEYIKSIVGYILTYYRFIEEENERRSLVGNVLPNLSPSFQINVIELQTMWLQYLSLISSSRASKIQFLLEKKEILINILNARRVFLEGIQEERSFNLISMAINRAHARLAEDIQGAGAVRDYVDLEIKIIDATIEVLNSPRSEQ